MNKFIYTTSIDKIRKMTKRIKVIQGGTSAGKTFGIIPILINKAIENEGLEISVVSESIPHLRRGVIKDFLKIMKWTNRFIPNNWNKTHLRYDFNNKSYIEFFSVEDDSKLRGARRNILYVNEANNISYEAYTQLSIRTNGDIYLDYNPVNKFWVHTEVLNDDDSELLILTYRDNEALDKTIIKQLEKNIEKSKTSDYWKNWCRVYIDGQIGSLEGVVYSNWDIIDQIPEEARYIGSGIDFGYTNDPSVLVDIYKYNEEIIIDEIFYLKGLSNSEIVRLIKQNRNNSEIYADSAEPKTIDEIRKYGINIKGAKKGKDSINYGISILQEYKMLITKRSKNIIKELENYIWLKDREGNTTNTPIDNYNHGLDAIRYFAMMKLNKKPNGKIKIIRR